ncbi:MAG: hypothetical protein LUE14_12935, partial [Clostridiales bacterium]|nr:hypothetical protein [Clostridiales bacterium]
DGTFTMDYDDYTVPSCLENDIIFTIQSSNGVLMSYNGYPDIDTMFNKLMVPNLETFNYETSIE